MKFRSIEELIDIAEKKNDELSELGLEPYEHLLVTYMIYSSTQYAYNTLMRQKKDEVMGGSSHGF